MFDGDRHRHHVHHGLDAIGHQPRLGHQAGAKSTPLHPLGRAAAVEVDRVIPPLLAQPCAMREVRRFTAPQLQRNRVFLRVETQVP